MIFLLHLFKQPCLWLMALVIADVVLLYLHWHQFSATLISNKLQTSFYFLNNVVIAREIPQWLPYVNQGMDAGRDFLASLSLMQAVYYFSASWLKSFNYLDLYVLSISVDRLVFIIGAWYLFRLIFNNLFAQIVAMAMVVIYLMPMYQMEHAWYIFYCVPFILFYVLRCLRTRSKRSFVLLILFVVIQLIAMYRMDGVKTPQEKVLKREQFKFHQQPFSMRETEQHKTLVSMSSIAMPVWRAVTSDKLMMFNRIATCPDEDTVSFFLRHGDYRGYVPFIIDPKANMVQDCLTNLTADRRINAIADVFRYSANRVVLSVDNPQDGWLTYTDRWHPVWRATVDNQEVKIAQVNLMYKMIPVSQGTHVIEFVYLNPLTSCVQWALALLMVIAVLVIVKMTIQLYFLRN